MLFAPEINNHVTDCWMYIYTFHGCFHMGGGVCLCVCVCGCVHVCMHAHMYMHTCVQLCVHAYMSACVYGMGACEYVQRRGWGMEGDTVANVSTSTESLVCCNVSELITTWSCTNEKKFKKMLTHPKSMPLVSHKTGRSVTPRTS